jgi:hypothetical protein
MTISTRRSRRALAAALASAVAAACSTGDRDPPPPVGGCELAGPQGEPPVGTHEAKPGVAFAGARASRGATVSSAAVADALGCDQPPAIPSGAPFTISGTVTYDFVPAVYDPRTASGGLDFAHSELRPVREAVVEIRQCGNVLSTTSTDAAGHYTATFVPGAIGDVGVYVLARIASPPLVVQDNWSGATWAVAQPITSSSPTLDVHATHGWTGSGYGPSRIAAPFAILDTVYTASRRLLDLPRAVAFQNAPLALNWSPLNTPDAIGTTFYDSRVRQIFLLGAEGIDTDEFDREVIAHEWGHYFEDSFSRSDSPGGQHGLGDELDPRLAFGEGFASAFAAMLLEQPTYADTYWGYSSMDAFGWDVESRPVPTDDRAPSTFSELSVVRAMWDLYDSGTNEPATDDAALGLAPIFDALVGPERSTRALTTMASFVTGLKSQPGVPPAAVDGVLASHGMGAMASEWGDGDGGLRAMYVDVPAPSSTAYQVTATLDGRYRWNERPQNRYYVFTATGSHATVVSSSASDVDLYALRAGAVLAAAESTSGNERVAFATVPGEVYVVVLTGWGGISSGAGCYGAYPVTLRFSSP